MIEIKINLDCEDALIYEKMRQKVSDAVDDILEEASIRTGKPRRSYRIDSNFSPKRRVKIEPVGE